MELNKLTEKEKKVILEKGTEPPFSGEYVDLQDDGLYHCKQCDAPIFDSKDKSDSRSGPIGLQGWPHFRKPIEGAISTAPDTSYGMNRTEVLCSKCGGHLGHVFEDEESEGKHYCINSCSLDFDPKK